MDFDLTYNPFSLKGKTILITGASSGIGRSTALECAKLGADCIITGRNQERLEETLSQMPQGNHSLIVTDLANQEGINLLVEQVPSIDGLVINAGITKKKTITFYQTTELEELFYMNTFSPMLLVKGLLKKKKLKIASSIVFLSSISSYSSNLGNGMYGASKAALTSYMHYCARELAPKKIRANAVHPGMVETPLIRNKAFSDDDLELYMDTYPLKRFGKPEEIAYAIIYLLSDASEWVTGTSLVIDGGISLK